MHAPAARAPHARPYGSGADDLDVAFGGGRAEAVTALLERCLRDARGQRCDADAIWRWTLAERLQALLAVRLAGDAPALDVQADCAHCGEAMAIALDLRDFARAAPPPAFRWRAAGGGEIELRLPRGDDLRRWQHSGLPDARELVAALATAAAGDDKRPDDVLDDPDALAAIERAFEAHDPLSALHLHARCPACACDNAIDCDLEALLLAGFARTQARLIDEVARLAGAFHWSEAQILALPPWRRAEYLRRLDAGAWA